MNFIHYKLTFSIILFVKFWFLNGCPPEDLSKGPRALAFRGPICNKPCGNGGTCVANDSCVCLDGFVGPTCEEKLEVILDSLPPTLCEKCIHGKCIDNFCSCDSGWSGELCSEAICDFECNNGECSSPNACSCESGYSGQQCDIQVLDTCYDPSTTTNMVGKLRMLNCWAGCGPYVTVLKGQCDRIPKVDEYSRCITAKGFIACRPIIEHLGLTGCSDGEKADSTGHLSVFDCLNSGNKAYCYCNTPGADVSCRKLLIEDFPCCYERGENQQPNAGSFFQSETSCQSYAFEQLQSG